MKKSFFILCLFISFQLLSQEKLKITYDHQYITDFDLTDEIKKNPEFVAAIRKAREQIHSFELLIDGDESNFIPIEKIDNSPPQGIKISFSKGGRELNYRNISKGYYLRELENFNQKFIIHDSLKKYDWQIERSKDKILNYEVRKAVAQIDSLTTVTAWYTPEIPLKHGPDDYWGLPGLILKVEVDKNTNNRKNHHYFSATNIQIADSKESIKIPTKGKKLSQKEYQELEKTKIEEMRQMYKDGVDTSD
ncbi:MAG: GLPGLI family protein [Flavobacteriaceae bacterium]|nr:GLPGLI family protein [Flavobacteriaceae bacterium]